MGGWRGVWWLRFSRAARTTFYQPIHTPPPSSSPPASLLTCTFHSARRTSTWPGYRRRSQHSERRASRGLASPSPCHPHRCGSVERREVRWRRRGVRVGREVVKEGCMRASQGLASPGPSRQHRCGSVKRRRYGGGKRCACVGKEVSRREYVWKRGVEISPWEM